MNLRIAFWVTSWGHLMTKLFCIIFVISAFIPLLAKAAVGDKYMCISTQYVDMTFDGEIVRYRPVQFEFLWDSPKDSPEEILWFPENPELIASKTLFLIEPLPEYMPDEKETINFNHFQPSIVTDTGGLFRQGKLYLTHIGLGSITSLIANCQKSALN